MSENSVDLLEQVDVDDPEYKPIPLLDMGDEMILSDGHTRAFPRIL